jgi:hypothetical protein
MGVTIEGVWNCELIYWPFIHTTSNYSATANLHNSHITKAPGKPFSVCCILTIRSLTTASNSGDSSASRAQAPSSQPPVQISTELKTAERDCRFSTNWVAPIVFKVIPRTYHMENTSVSIVVVQLLQLPSNRLHNTVPNSNSIVVEACSPRCCIATAVISSSISRSLPSNRSHSLTHTWSWALLEKLPLVQPLKNFPAFYGTRRFITVFTRALHYSLSWAISIQSMRSILILSTHVRRGLPSGLF